LIGAARAQVSTPPVNIILDSDIASNVDDVGDHALLWGLVKNGEANVLALITSSANDYSAPTVYAIAKYCNHPNVPIGAYQGNTPGSYDTTFSYYTQQVTNQFGKPGDTRRNYPDPVTVYRQALANAPNNSVSIVAGGFYEPLYGLLRSGPDAISTMTGMQLVSAKVKQLVPVAGWFPDSGTYQGSYNFANDADAASYVIANWPTPIVFVGTEVGYDVVTGPAANADPIRNPIKLAYNLYCGNGQWCPNTQTAWTQVGILYAVRGGMGSMFTYGGLNGTTVIWNNSQAVPGRNIWTQSPNAQRSYIEKIVPASTMQNIINPLIQGLP
jgi:inosine-uridine nucleoside N-ribohydrolase